MKHYYYMGAQITKGLYDQLNKQDVPLRRTLYVKDDEEVTRGRCRVCGCTMRDPCVHPSYGACWWVDDKQDLCSFCAKGVLNRRERNAVMHRAVTVRMAIKWANDEFGYMTVKQGGNENRI